MDHTTSSTTTNEYRLPNSGTTNSNAKALGRAKKRRQPRRSPQSIKPEDLKSLLDAVTNPRNRALLLILIESGLRMGEIARLDRSTIRVVTSTSADGSEVRLGTGEILLSKQARCRSFWVGSDSVNAVADYLAKDRAADDEPALFVTKQGQRISTLAIRSAVASWCKSAGIEPIGCHRFRQTLALNLANAGVSYPAMMRLLGYSNPKSALRFFPDHREDHPSPGIFRRLLGFLKGK